MQMSCWRVAIAYVFVISQLVHYCSSIRKSPALDADLWTWIAGCDTANSRENRSAPFPASRHGPSAWQDNSNRLWLFGGRGFVSGATYSKALNDLWMYHPWSNKWELVRPSDFATNSTSRPPCFGCAACSHSDQAVVFGGETQDTWLFNMTSQEWNAIPNDGRSMPDGREEPAAWCDKASGVLWMFGGSKSRNKLSDLWKFSLTDLQWEKVTFAITGNQTSPSPGARSAASTWLHPSGNLYLFGGHSENGLVGDLWVFSPPNSTWQRIWVGNSSEKSGSYGKMHVASRENHPGSRRGGFTWTDRNGDLWLFGGSGYDKHQGLFAEPGLLSDLWLYSTKQNLWAWMGGLDASEGKPTYGKKGQPDISNLPGPRESGVSFTWGDRLWMFGGEGHDKYQRDGLLSDIWAYNELQNSKTNQPTLEGDTLKLPDEMRILLGLLVLLVAMVFSLLVCYRKECCILFKTPHYGRTYVRYRPVKVRMQVPGDDLNPENDLYSLHKT